MKDNTNRVTTAVIPVAGFGTRMLPATKSIPKELLPIVDVPLIQKIIEECAQSGISHVVLVTHSAKTAIENHFDINFELESQLRAKSKNDLLAQVQSCCPQSISLSFVRQGEAKGLGHAVEMAKSIVGDKPFAVLLPDVLIDEASADYRSENLAAMINRFQQTGFSQIAVEPVHVEKVSSYGVVDIGDNQLSAGESTKMNATVEKPPVDEAPSNLAVLGRYVLSAKIWQLLGEVDVGAGGEIQLTDAIDKLIAIETVEAFHMTGHSHDCGSKIGYIKAVIDYACRHPEIGDDIQQYIKSIK